MTFILYLYLYYIVIFYMTIYDWYLWYLRYLRYLWHSESSSLNARAKCKDPFAVLRIGAGFLLTWHLSSWKDGKLERWQCFLHWWAYPIYRIGGTGLECSLCLFSWGCWTVSIADFTACDILNVCCVHVWGKWTNKTINCYRTTIT